MHTRSIVALAGSLLVVAASMAMFVHSMGPPAFDITLAPSVIDGLPVDNLAPVVVTPDRTPAQKSSALRRQLSNSIHVRRNLRALGSVQQVMPYYSFARSLASFNKD